MHEFPPAWEWRVERGIAYDLTAWWGRRMTVLVAMTVPQSNAASLGMRLGRRYGNSYTAAAGAEAVERPAAGIRRFSGRPASEDPGGFAIYGGYGAANVTETSSPGPAESVAAALPFGVANSR